jgi:RHH-type proline utilization regulon transcriptional repressor/proline dehydrogenase/delta 1-pyrroline-5-carboxylate dehydrogenase
MQELVLGDPALLSTDIGPVIDEEALGILQSHAARMDSEAKRKIAEVPAPAATAKGTFFAPRAYELKSLSQLTREIFGPVLHVLRYEASDLDNVIADINATGYGLTLGIHSRIDENHRKKSRAACGSATATSIATRSVLWSACNLSAAKASPAPARKPVGPHYLLRFTTERTLTINTTAAGGNASLLTLGE